MDEYDYGDFDGYQLFLNIEEVRMLYSHITYSIQKWPRFSCKTIRRARVFTKTQDAIICYDGRLST